MSSCFVVKLFGREQNSDQNSWNFSKFGFEHFWANLKCHSFLDFYRSEKCYWAFMQNYAGGGARRSSELLEHFKIWFWKFLENFEVISLFVELFQGEQNSGQNSWNFSKFGFENFRETLKCHSFLDFDRSEKCY